MDSHFCKSVRYVHEQTMAANYIKTNFVCHSYAMYNKSKNGPSGTTTG